jgi:hypothetical protein
MIAAQPSLLEGKTYRRGRHGGCRTKLNISREWVTAIPAKVHEIDLEGSFAKWQ